MNIKVLAFLLLITSAFPTLSYATSGKGKIEWSEVPLKAQQIITQHALEGKILKVKKEKIILMTDKGEENKTFLYLARVKKPDGKKFWIIVNQSGELIDIEDEETEKVLEDVEERKKQEKNH